MPPATRQHCTSSPMHPPPHCRLCPRLRRSIPFPPTLCQLTRTSTFKVPSGCNVSIPARLESILKPPDYCTSDLQVPDSGLGPLGPLGPPHFGSGNLGSITHVVHEAYSTYSVVVRSNIVFFSPNECNRGCASTPACHRTLSARTSEVAPSVASVVLLHRYPHFISVSGDDTKRPYI